MIYSWANFGNPFFWLFWAGLFLGAAISRTLRSRLRLDRWVLVYLYLVVAVTAVTVAFVVPRLAVGVHGMKMPAPVPETMQRSLGQPLSTSVVFVLAMTLVEFLVARFRLVAGIPAVVAVAFVVLVTGASLRGTSPLRGGEAEAGSFRALAFSDGAMTVEIIAFAAKDTPPVLGGLEGWPGAAANTPSYETIHAYAVAAVVQVFTVPDWFFFLSSPRYYRFEGLAARDRPFGRSHDDRVAAPGHVASLRFPVFRASPRLSIPLVPSLLQDYRVVLHRDLTVEVTPATAEKQ